jgi:molecular chaperone DnaJ
MAKKDYYEILGVKRTDSDETIKKAYKKLALQHHPDKASPDKKKEYEDKFKEINEAYSTIGDEAKRRKYDTGGESPFGGHSSSSSRGRGGGDFSDIFGDLFRGGSFGGSPFGDEDEEEVDKDLHYEITIEFKEAVFGCEKEISVKKYIPCDVCDGTGAEDKQFENCPKCGGQGRLRINQKTPWGVMSQIVKCPNCEGEGKIPESECSHCDGQGVFESREKVKIKIPKGIDNNQTLRIRGAGNAVKNGAEGDLFLLIKVNPHKIFKRDGVNIYMDLSISFSQAALGSEVSIPTLSDEEIKIKIAKGTETGDVLRLKGRGIPSLKDSHHFGDQFVNVTVKTPKKLSKAQIKLFEELAKLEG